MYSFFAWLLSLSTKTVRLIHSAARISSLLSGHIVFHCMHLSQFVYPFICGWTFLLFRGLGYYKGSSSEHSCIIFLSGHMFPLLLDKYLGAHWLGHMLSKCTSNFLGNC